MLIRVLKEIEINQSVTGYRDICVCAMEMFKKAADVCMCNSKFRKWQAIKEHYVQEITLCMLFRLGWVGRQKSHSIR